MNKYLALIVILAIQAFATELPIKQYQTLQTAFIKSSWLNSNLLDKEVGTIFIKKPNMFKYQTQNTTLITKNNQVILIDKKLEQVSMHSLDQFPFIKLLLNLGEADFNKYFNSYATKNTGEYKLLPKTPNNLFKFITIVTKNQQISKLIIHTSLEQRIMIILQNVKLNQPIEDSIFEYIIPEEFDVITEN